MRALQILIIDDEPAIRQILANTIAKAGHAVTAVQNGGEALERLAKGDIEVALCDIRMPDMTGIDVVGQARQAGIDTTFLMMTAYASVNTAIDAMRSGAYDYMVKPLRNEDVLNRLEKLSDVIRLRSENEVLRGIVLGRPDDQCRMTSPAMQEIDRLIAKVAPKDSTVLITGASGSGKGIIARSIHQNSKRAQGAFIPVNCGAIPENLLESEFFGHTKGAFTGANKAKRGLFVEADQGTLFLDEIGELPLNLQVKLLHAIEDQSVRAVGSEQSRPVNVRIVAATNQNLEKMVEEGSFREDLYFRLNVFHIHLPPLRDRPEDISNLIDFFIRQEAGKLDLSGSVSIDPNVRSLLCAYEWPGNVRELQNVISRTLILTEDNHINMEDLPSRINHNRHASESEYRAVGGSLKEQIRAFEIAVIRRTIDEVDGDRREAAKLLGIGVSSLYRKLDETDQSVSM